MENIIIVFLLIVLIFLFFIYKKLDQGKNTEDFSTKYAVLSEKLDTLTNKTESFRDNLNRSQIDLSDKLTNKQNDSEKEIKSDLGKLNESLAVIVTAQKELNELQGVKNSWFCGSYFGYGFHEDGLKSSINIAKQI